MALLQNGDTKPLPMSIEKCDCFVTNSTVLVEEIILGGDRNDGEE